MRILFVCQAFLPHFEGGTERVARAHARALRELGHELLIVAAAPPGSQPEAEVDGLPVRFVEESSPGSDPLAERLWIERPGRRDAVLELAREFAPDVVHVQHLASLSLGLVQPLRALGCRVFVSLHDLFVTCPRFFRDPIAGVRCPGPGEFAACAACIAPEAPGFECDELKAALLQRHLRMVGELALADGLLAPSASHGRRLEALLGLETGSIQTLPNGLTEDLARVAPLGPPVGNEPLELLFFGHRARTKGLVELVRAASKAAETAARPLGLTCLGAPLEPGLDAELGRLAPPLALRLGGPYTQPELARAAAGAHLAVFPSKALESYGLVVDEALALGLPVLASSAGALGERVGAAGLVLDSPTSPSALAQWTDALVELAREPARLEAWRAAIPDRMPGPSEAAAALLKTYSPPRP